MLLLSLSLATSSPNPFTTIKGRNWLGDIAEDILSPCFFEAKIYAMVVEELLFRLG